MRRIMNQFKFGRDETGQMLIYVILILVLALLVMPPVLEFGFGSHRTAQIREDRMLKVYAADAGIEHAYYSIKNGNITYDPYTLTNINGYDVHVQIEDLPGKNLYRVLSTAYDPYGVHGANVTIESHTGTTNFGGLFNNVLTSQQDIRIRPGSYVYGNVTYNGVLTGGSLIDGNITKGLTEWPEVEELREHYWPQVQYYPYTPENPLTIGNQTVYLGPNYIPTSDPEVGNPMIIEGLNNMTNGNLTLTGTLYVQGDLTLGLGGANAFNLRLGNQTIYVEGDLLMYQEVHVYGPGCIIAEGNIDFQPHPEGDEFVFVMAVTGEIKVHPGSSFQGSFAGKMKIDLQPGTEIRWVQYPTDENGDPNLNFPGGSGTAVRVMDYIIRD